MAKRVSLYGMLAALCMVLGYLESLVPLVFIAPGVKLGLSNAVALLLIARGDIKGAFLVNITRILLSALLFSSPFSLIFSLSAGLISLAAMSVISRFKFLSIVGFSVLGGTVHNTVQLTAAAAVMGSAVWYYLPVLLIAGAVSGGVIGTLSGLIEKKCKM